MNRVSKTLFRSLLRWNRSNAASRAPLLLNTKDFDLSNSSLSSLVPPSIDSHEQLHGLLLYSFRSLPASPENIDMGFRALKVLNDYGVVLRDHVLQRKVHRNELFLSHAKYQVGQVVMNRFTKVRGVVVGWDVDLSRGAQSVELLLDKLDVKEFLGQSSSSSRSAVLNKLVDSDHLQLVTDPQLLRIINPKVNDLFYFVDDVSQRYVPKPALAFRYPTTDGTVFTNPLLDDEKNRQSVEKVVSGVRTLGQHLQVILDEYFPGLVEEHLARKRDSFVGVQEDNEVAHQVLRELLDHVDGMVCAHPSLRNDLSADNNKLDMDSLAQRIPRGPRVLAQRHAEDEKDEKENNNKPFVFAQRDQVAIETAYGAVFSLSECLTSLYQLLQLRFQSRGVAFSDRLRVVEPNSPQSLASSHTTQDVQHTSAAPPHIRLLPLHQDVASLDNHALLPTAVYSVGTVIRHKKYGYRGVISGFDHRPLLNVSQWDGVRQLPSRASQPFYRVIPDSRDTERFLGEGEYRPYFYVAQENIEEIKSDREGEGERLVSHDTLSQYFLGWDVAAQRFRVPLTLRYCFPSGHYALPEEYPDRTTLSAHWREKSQRESESESDKGRDREIERELVAHETLDELLLELLSHTKRVLCAMRDHHALSYTPTDSLSHPQPTDTTHTHTQPTQPTHEENNTTQDALLFTVRDLLTLLRHAPSREASLPVESLAWYLWTAAHDADTSTLLRLGMSCMKRDDRDNAVACYKLAAQLTPQAAEPHNKLAAIYHTMEMHEDCLSSAKLALEAFPEHYGALAGMGLSYEKLGDEAKAIECIRKSLSLNPHAANLPTVLQSILTMPKTKQKSSSESPSAAPDSASEKTDV